MITEENIDELNKKKEKYLLAGDALFKFVFQHEYILKDFLDSFLEYINMPDEVLISSVNSQYEIPALNKYLLNCYSDLVCILKSQIIISLELYNTFNKRAFNKSLKYTCMLYGNQDFKSDVNDGGSIKYENMKEVMSINLIRGNYKRMTKDIVNSSELKTDYNEIITENIKMILIRIDQIEKIPYDKNEKRFIRYLRLINAKTVEELMEYAKGDRIMNDVVEYVRAWRLDSTKKNYEKFKERLIKKGETQGINRGIKQGIELGKTAGINEEKATIAQNMCNRGMSIEDIIAITGLTKEEVLKIIN